MPGGAVPAVALVPAPMTPGDYRLRLELVQVQDRPLAACGVTPLDWPLHVRARPR
jgi:hypothetical protein